MKLDLTELPFRLKHSAALCIGPLLAFTSTSLVGQTQKGAAEQLPVVAKPQQQQLQELIAEVAGAEERARASERELAQLKARLQAMQTTLDAATVDSGTKGMQPSVYATVPEPAAAPATEEDADTHEVQASEIATLDQAKVETDSKYPFRLNGLILLTTSNNSSAVDSPVDPTASLHGPGSLSLSLRQTLLGFGATGPHLAGASSSADLRVDFFGSASSTAYPNAGGLLRLRTAHAALAWQHARLYFAMDRPLLSPDTPDSLVQTAEPALAWSGNLWNWAPQLGVSTRFGTSHQFVAEGAWISAPDPPYSSPTGNTGGTSEPSSLAGSSRVPGGEVRIAYTGGDALHGPRIGVGGYVSPHHVGDAGSFTAWAGTLDLRLPITQRVQFTGAAYRGQGLGGLGAGAYKDYAYGEVGGAYRLRALEDVGGWGQVNAHLSHTLDWNTAFGMDNIFARQARQFTSISNSYANVARNRTVYTNLIWSPKAAVLFSLEYRRLATFPVTGNVWNANIFAGAAGYRF